ncbi:MAG: component of the polarisome [Chrysothrix sp. TS-e1954]|nr:MAG: component of the polarisome [Chrysothrix sp. TS-e1954]
MNGYPLNGPLHGPPSINGQISRSGSPMNGPLDGPMPRRGGPPPSPPISVARSSTGTGSGMHPPNGVGHEGGRKYSPQMLEQQLAEHHRVLREYLAQSIREDKTYQPHNRARDKLLRLSPIQFRELSTDVYDELLRREDERRVRDPRAPPHNVPRFLLPKQNFHPKRNQARQKLSTLAIKKFRELATDVLFELERRFPRFAPLDENGHARSISRGPPSRPGTSQGTRGPPLMTGTRPRQGSNASSVGPYSPGVFEGGSRFTPSSASSEYVRGLPHPKTFQSNTMVPNKGTMIEDDDDQSGEEEDPYDLDRATVRSSRRTTNRDMSFGGRDRSTEHQTQLSDLETKIQDLQDQLHQKTEAHKTTQAQSSDLQSSLQKQLDEARSLNASLEAELSTARSPTSDPWEQRYHDLEAEFHQQQQITEEVRQDATRHLQEMRDLSERSMRRPENEQKLAKQVADLEASVQSWKTRYTKTRTQLRDLRAGSMASYLQNPTAAQFTGKGGPAKYNDPKGMVRDVSVTKFQLSIDELMGISRSGEPKAVLEYMRRIVEAVRAVTGDSDAAAKSLKETEEMSKRRTKFKNRIAAATNHLITTAKTYAQSGGMAPVSLVDAAAGHVTSAVVDFVRVVKVRPSPVKELEDGEFA